VGHRSRQRNGKTFPGDLRRLFAMIAKKAHRCFARPIITRSPDMAQEKANLQNRTVCSPVDLWDHVSASQFAWQRSSIDAANASRYTDVELRFLTPLAEAVSAFFRASIERRSSEVLDLTPHSVESFAGNFPVWCLGLQEILKTLVQNFETRRSGIAKETVAWRFLWTHLMCLHAAHKQLGIAS
jgi:hypothetical protein